MGLSWPTQVTTYSNCTWKGQRRSSHDPSCALIPPNTVINFSRLHVSSGMQFYYVLRQSQSRMRCGWKGRGFDSPFFIAWARESVSLVAVPRAVVIAVLSRLLSSVQSGVEERIYNVVFAVLSPSNFLFLSSRRILGGWRLLVQDFLLFAICYLQCACVVRDKRERRSGVTFVFHESKYQKVEVESN